MDRVQIVRDATIVGRIEFWGIIKEDADGRRRIPVPPVPQKFKCYSLSPTVTEEELDAIAGQIGNQLSRVVSGTAGGFEWRED